MEENPLVPDLPDGSQTDNPFPTLRYSTPSPNDPVDQGDIFVPCIIPVFPEIDDSIHNPNVTPWTEKEWA